MARRFTAAVASSATVALLLAAGCSSPSSRNEGGGNKDDNKITEQKFLKDPNAKGPAKPIDGAKTGGTLIIKAKTTVHTMDPTDIYYVDSNEIGKLLFRTPTQFHAVGKGDPVLIPDLTDLGTEAPDKLSWTFKVQPGIKYADGTDVKIEDFAYAIKRSFAHDIYADGPTYQMQYFKDGDKYKGPYKSGDTYAGVETIGTDTLKINLAKPFPDLPYYMSFPMFTPIPKAKDTKQDYKNNPLATGPYQFDKFTPGAKLTLKRNPHWKPETDPGRHAYPDAWEINWGGDPNKTQAAILKSDGTDANTINYDELDPTLIPQIQGGKQDQLAQGQSPCTASFQLDTRKIPLPLRKAIAIAYPYDQIYKAAGLNDYIAEKASTILPPSVPGYQKYPPVEGLTGTGNGDPAAARKILEQEGKLGFELSYYYDNQRKEAQQSSTIRAEALTQAGFKVKPIGVATAELRAKLSDYKAPVNMGQSPSGWCSDWPTISSWYPVLFQTHSIEDGQSWGMLSDPALDKEIDALVALPAEQQVAKAAEMDRKIMERYIALPRYYDKMAIVKGINVGTIVGDATMGMPYFPYMYLKS